MRAYVLILAVALVSCGPPRPTVEQLAASDDAQCRSYGAQPGTDTYVQCRMSINQQRQQARTAMAAILSRPAPAPVPAPQPYMLPAPAPMTINTPPPPVNCTSTAMGNTVNTHCY